MSGKTILTTQRLRVRTWQHGDSTLYARHCNTDEVMEWLGGVMSPRELQLDLRYFRNQQKRNDFTFWVVERKHDKAFLGFCGLVRVDELRSSVLGEVEVGWRIRSDMWRRGSVKGIAPASGRASRSVSRAMPRPRKPANPFRYFHSSPEVIRLVVMMYIRFPLSLRNVEDLLFERGIDLCHETVRLWWNRFGPMFAADIRRQRVSRMRGFRHWKWHLDEVYVKINGEMHYLWRAVDHEGEVLESYVTKTRDKKAALTFIRKALKRHGRAEAIVTDGLRSYPAAMRELGNEERREMGRHANNRAENSHLPFRRRERAMQRFRQMKSLQKFASVHASIQNHFNQERHLVDRQTYKQRRSVALAEWQNLAA